MRVTSRQRRFDGLIFRNFRVFLLAMFACIHAPDIPALTEFAYGFSPIVEEIGKGMVVIDVEGCELLFGSPYQLAGELVKRTASPISVAVAASPDAPIHAARHLKGITFVSPGEELT